MRKNVKIILNLRILFAYSQFLLYFCGAKLVLFGDIPNEFCSKCVLL